MEQERDVVVCETCGGWGRWSEGALILLQKPAVVYQVASSNSDDIGGDARAHLHTLKQK